MRSLLDGVLLLSLAALQDDAPPPRVDDERLAELARRCAAELPWAATWEEAASRARAEHKLVLALVLMYAGFAIGDDDALAPFADLELVDLVRERFVPLRLNKGTRVPFEDPESYGIGPLAFGSGWMLVTPEGEVVAETIGEPGEFLLANLVAEGDLADPAAASDPSARRAELELALARGELARVGALLAAAREPEDLRLRAAWHARARRADDARADLAAARALDDGSLAGDLSLDEGVLDLRVGSDAAALERFAAVPADHPRRGEARFRAGQALLALGRRAEAEAAWHALAAERPDDRWAAQAARSLRSSGFRSGSGESARWLAPAYRELLRPRALAPLPPEAAAQAVASARAWLLDAQQPDGAWICPADGPPGAAGAGSEFRLAATALAVRALLPFRDDAEHGPRVRAAIERGLAFAHAEHARLIARERGLVFMDYGVWSRPLLLRLFADLCAAGIAERAELADAAASVVAYLEREQKADGGWGYYVTGDLSQGAAPATPAMSFTTAGVLLGLADARAAGFEVPNALLERGFDLLEATRNEDGSFEYWLYPGAPRPGAPVGASGRGPVCTLALVRGGRAGDEQLGPACALFSEHRAKLAAEAGKILMHCGPGGLGSHYPYFDYAGVAECLERLPADVRGRRRLELFEVLLAARAEDGSFLDQPLIGRPIATALALLALSAAG